MELTLNYVHNERIGYGRLGVYLAAELAKRGIKVYDAIEGDPIRSDVRDGNIQGKTNVVCWVSTPSHARGWWKGQKACMFTMYEAMELPASLTENLHEFDTVIVPSHQNHALFSKFHDNVHFLPLGVDPELWHFVPRRRGRDFNFLIGGSGPRKGVDLAIQAFLKVFGDEKFSGPIPHLILKSPRGLNPNNGDKCISQEAADHPRVQIIGGYLDPADEVALYESAHCYLQPSRGEGFGLQPLQAIAQGIPTILTAAHGHDSFAHLGYGLDSTPTKAGYFMHGESGDWWEPSFDDLCAYMRWVYENYAAACLLARQSADIVAKDFTWERCAEKFVDILGPDRLTPYSGPEIWFTPTSKLYEVVTNKDRLIDVGGVKRLYQRGKVYWEPADVKRILFDAGYLAADCLKGEDTGLHPNQLGDARAYAASHEYCPTCTQRLNSGITKADDEFTAMNGISV